MSDRRDFNPVRAHKRAFRQEHVAASLRRALRQGSGVGWTVGAPTATARPGAVQAGAEGAPREARTIL